MENLNENVQNNEIIIKDSIQTIDSREVAKMIDVTHANLLKKVRSYEEILTKSKLTSLDFFIPSEYKDPKGELRTCYLLTKKGCEMVANKLTGEKGVIFTAKYVTRFEEMEKGIAVPKIPTNTREILMLTIKAHEETAQRVDKLEDKVSNLANTMTVTSSQQYTLNKIAKEHILSILGGKDTPAYLSLSKKVFSAMWRDYKNYFKIPSYRDTLQSSYETAMNYLKNWRPDMNLAMEIDYTNRQMSINA